MPIWFVFIVVALTFFGATVWMTAAADPAHSADEVGDAAPSETEAWWQLIAPLLAGAPFFAFMFGWALQESNPADELIPLGLAVPAAVVGAVVVRAILRALRSAASAHHVAAPIATVGLLRPQAVVSPAFAAQASREVLAAALAHEAAHVRGRDPLRIWLAQFAADLQWPIANARRRFRRWALALEVRRDDEALVAGADPTALAEGLILAAQIGTTASPRPADLESIAAEMTGRGNGLALRVRRLLDAPTTRPGRRTPPYRVMACATALTACTVLGTMFGDEFLLMLPGVVR